MTATFVTFLGDYSIQYTLLDATSPVIGISFVLILLRLNFNKHGSSTISSDRISQGGAPTSHRLRTISVNVSKHVVVDSDVDSTDPGKDSYGHPM